MKCSSAPLTAGHLLLFFVSAPIEHYWLPLPLFPQSNSTDCNLLTHDDGKKYKSNFLMRIYVTLAVVVSREIPLILCEWWL